MYKITLTNKITCVDLETELGLERGAVVEVREQQNGIVEVLFDKEPSADQKTSLQSALDKRIYAEGAE